MLNPRPPADLRSLGDRGWQAPGKLLELNLAVRGGVGAGGDVRVGDTGSFRGGDERDDAGRCWCEGPLIDFHRLPFVLTDR